MRRAGNNTDWAIFGLWGGFGVGLLAGGLWPWAILAWAGAALLYLNLYCRARIQLPIYAVLVRWLAQRIGGGN